MKLTFDQIRSVTQGASRLCRQDNGIALYRFNEAEDALYTGTTFDLRRFSGTGIQLEFQTDATALTLKVCTGGGSSRSYFSYDIFENNTLIGCLRNYSDDIFQLGDYTDAVCPLGRHCGQFSLSTGIKTLRIVLPWSVSTVIEELSLENASFVTPVKLPKTILMYGDSITQGYDALNPSRAYAMQLARSLNAEIFNKGVGGERFNPDLAAIKNDITPDYITVAYGTNDVTIANNAQDWNPVTFEKTCRGFYETLRKNYPEAKIIGISPIWREDAVKDAIRIPLEQAAEIIQTVCRDVNAVFVHGWELVPHDTKFFGDLRLHPSNEGFDHFYRNLANQLTSL